MPRSSANDPLAAKTVIRSIGVALCVLLQASCGHAAGNDAATAQSMVAASPTAAVIKRKAIAMAATKPCGNSNLDRSLCMAELMLEDIRQTYDWPSGGGISTITQRSSTSYTISLPQEERTDLFTYDFQVTDKAVSIKTKTPGTQSY